MGWFGGKSGHKQNVESMLGLAFKLYENTSQSNPELPPLHFERADSRCRYFLFCLSTIHLACASKMKNPDAVLNECVQTLFRYCLSDQQTFFGGTVEPQEAVNKVAPCLQDYLQRWSSYVDIVSGGNHLAAQNIVSAMIHDTESATPPSPADTQRLDNVALWVQKNLDGIRTAFK